MHLKVFRMEQGEFKETLDEEELVSVGQQTGSINCLRLLFFFFFFKRLVGCPDLKVS